MVETVETKELSALSIPLRAMTVYRGVLGDAVVRALCGVLEAQSPPDAADCWGEALAGLQESGLSLCDHVYRAVLYDDNAFTRACAAGRLASPALTSAARRDLRCLAGLAYLTPDGLRGELARRFPERAGELRSLPDFAVGHRRYLADENDWANEIGFLRGFCAENGCGDDARFHALLCEVSDEALRALLEQASPRLRRMLLREAGCGCPAAAR